jgi:ATP-dependent Clp protease ATP-binding subunit ClpA
LHEPLIQLTENWTNKARQGLFKPSVHQQEAIKRVIETLNCKTSNNVLLLGRAGCGKTSLAQQIAILMASGEIHGAFKDRLFLALKLQDLLDLARTSPSTITNFIESLRKYAGSYILFVDEFHTFFQVHTKDGIPLHELFKPILADGKVRLIGASTQEDARRYILNQGEAVLRRFTVHKLPELSDVQSVDVLANSKESYEAHYSEHLGRQVVIHSEAFSTAVQEAKTRLTHQALPSSAITLFEGACSAKTSDDSSEAFNITSDDVLRFAEERFPLPKPISPTSWINMISQFFVKLFRFFWRW